MATVETKVTAGSLAAAASGVVLYCLQRWVFKGEVPADFQSLIYLAVPGAIALAAGWLAPHTHRPDLAPPAPPPVPAADTGQVQPKAAP